ncbi:hypothetical protein BGZ97_012727, partial [Linnemannia gamsii]
MNGLNQQFAGMGVNESRGGSRPSGGRPAYVPPHLRNQAPAASSPRNDSWDAPRQSNNNTRSTGGWGGASESGYNRGWNEPTQHHQASGGWNDRASSGGYGGRRNDTPSSGYPRLDRDVGTFKNGVQVPAARNPRLERELYGTEDKERQST